MLPRWTLAGLAALLVTASPARAATIVLDTFSPQQPGWDFASPSAGFLGELNNNANVASVTLSLVSPGAGLGLLSFELLGFRSLDTVSGGGDVLTVSINGSPQFSGRWGDNPAGVGFLTNPSGASFEMLYHAGLPFGSPAFGESTRWRLIVPFALVAGPNTFAWSYSPLQSLGDEAWGLDNVHVEAVPEPATFLLVAAGVLALPACRRMRRGR